MQPNVIPPKQVFVFFGAELVATSEDLIGPLEEKDLTFKKLDATSALVNRCNWPSLFFARTRIFRFVFRHVKQDSNRKMFEFLWKFFELMRISRCLLFAQRERESVCVWQVGNKLNLRAELCFGSRRVRASGMTFSR